MLDLDQILEDKVTWWNDRLESPYFNLNQFDGTFAITDHKHISEDLLMFLCYSFKTMRLERVPLESINDLLNEVWEGPGSMEKILRMAHMLRPTVNINQLDMPKVRPTKIEDDVPLADRSRSTDTGFGFSENH